MSSASSECFTSFSTWIAFISFPSLIAVAKTSKTMLASSGKNGHPCFVPDFRDFFRKMDFVCQVFTPQKGAYIQKWFL